MSKDLIDKINAYFHEIGMIHIKVLMIGDPVDTLQPAGRWYPVVLVQRDSTTAFAHRRHPTLRLSHNPYNNFIYYSEGDDVIIRYTS